MAGSSLIAGRYKRIRLLGEGGMGTVWLVEDRLRKGAPVALKTDRLDESSREAVAALKHEFRVLSRLDHPNLAKVFDFGTLREGGRSRFFFTSEFVDGQPLMKATDGASWETVYELAAQLLRALAWLHARGIFHRDVKPGNVLVTASGALKLVDFGIVAPAHVIDGRTLRGTPAYIAPEMIRGEPPDARTDLYALGVTLYQVATRRYPLDAPSNREMLAKQLREVPPPATAVRPDVPPALSAFLERLLAKEPAARFANADRALAALATIAGREWTAETGAPLRAVRMVGRERESARLREHVEGRLGSRAGVPPAIAVTGPFGAGKSRLLAELKVRLQLADVPVLSAEAGEGWDPLAPWASVVREAAATIAPAELREKWSRELGVLVPSLRVDSSADLEREELLLQRLPAPAASSFLAECSAVRPFAILLDELDQGGSALTETLEAFVRQLSVTDPAPRIAVVLACEAASPPALAVRGWVEAGLAAASEIGDLDPSQTALLAAAILGAESVTAESAKSLHRASHGNPFVIGELLSAVSGKARRLRGGEVLLPKLPAEPPKRLETLLKRRLAAVTGGPRALLDALATLDAPASLGAIQAMGISLDDDEGFAALDALLARGLAVRDENGRFALRPPILCEVARRDLSPRDAKRLHRLAGEWMEAAPEAESRAADLALHFAACGDDAREARWSRLAGFRLKRLYANEEALRLLSRAAALAPDPAVELAAAEVERLLGRFDDARTRLDRARSMSPPGEIEVPILLLQARLALASGSADGAWRLAEEARAAAPVGSPAALRVAATHAELLLEQGKAADAARIAQETAAALPDDDALPAKSRDAAADLLLAGGQAELAAHGAASAEPLVARAARLFSMSGDRRGEVRARHALGRIQFQRGRSAEALELFRGAVRGFLEVGDLAACGIAQMNLGVVLHGASDYVAAIEAYEDALAMLGPAGSARDRAMVGCNLANLLGLLGALEPARGHLERALAIARGAGLAFVEGYALLLLGVTALAEGNREEAESRLTDARRILAAAGNRRQACTAAAQLAEALREARRFDRASALLVDAESEARHVDAPDVLARCLDGRARIEVDRPGGDLALADELLAECGRLAELAGDREVRGEVRLTAARLHARRGDLASAVKILEELDREREEQRARLPPEWQGTFFRERERRMAREELVKLSGGGYAAPTPRSSMPTGVVPPADAPRTMTGSPWSADALRRLLEVVRAMNARRGIDELLAHILDASISLTGADRGLLLESEGDAFPARLARGADGGTLPPESFRVSRTVAEQVARTGGALVIAELGSDPRFRSVGSIALLEATSVLAVPLRGRSGAAGAVWLETRGRPGAFGERELELAQTFADQAGIALENARLLEDASRRAEELARAKAKNDELVKRLSDEVHETSRNLEAVREELARTRVEYVARHDYRNLVGSSHEMREVFRLLDRITETEVTVLIEGESGTGKELVARALHVNGPRSKGPFVAENCGAVPEGLLESVLFGHVKGAFTGAAADRKGLFELANGGTLFLDEVGEMPPSMQVKLLRALQESEVRRVGAAAPVKVDVRVIAATNRGLREEVAAKRFREDLFYRLNVVRIPLPPLRERRGDIPLLAKHFLARFKEQLGPGARGAGAPPGLRATGGRRPTEPGPRPASISDAAMAKLVRHPWPGNVRELENVLKSAYLLCGGKEIGPADLTLVAPAAEPPALRLLSGAKIEEVEERMIRDAMEKAGGRVAAAAELLGMPERTLYHKLSRLGLKRRRR